MRRGAGVLVTVGCVLGLCTHVAAGESLTVRLDDGRSVILDLGRISTPDLVVEVVGTDGRVRHLDVAANSQRVGHVRDDGQSFASVRRDENGWHGFVSTAGGGFTLQTDRAGEIVGHAVGGAVSTPYTSSLRCGAGDVSSAPPPATTLEVPSDETPIDPGARTVDVAVDTDYELWAKWGADEPAMDFVVALMEAANEIYEREFSLRLHLVYLRLWESPADPWDQEDYTAEIEELYRVWTTDPPLTPLPGLVYLLTGKTTYGDGIEGDAYLSGVCAATRFGVERTYGTTDPFDPLFGLVHELGHSFGSPHTHCYKPPLDHCYNQEQGCYAGPVEPSVGTVMSYCSLIQGYGSEIAFPDPVKDVIRTTIQASTCLRGTCDDFAADPSACDDGNPCTQDGCDPELGCTSTPIAGCCVDDADCDDGNLCTDDRCDATGHCVGIPVPDGTSCADFDPCVGGDEQCHGGICEPQPLHGYTAARCATGVLEAAAAEMSDARHVARVQRLADRLREDIDDAAAALSDGAQVDEVRVRREIRRVLGRLRRALKGKGARAIPADLEARLRAALHDIRAGLADR